MKTFLTLFFGLLVCNTGWGQANQARPPFVHDVELALDATAESIIETAAKVVPSHAQMLYHHDEFSGFIHFGPNTFSGVEWGNGRENPNIFDPGETLDTDQWCRILKAAGCKKVILTVKHHDGFCTWQTRYNDKFSVRAISWRDGNGDVLRELTESCAEHGLKVGVYLSPADLFQIESEGGLYGNGSKPQSTTIPTDPSSFQDEPTKVRVDKPADAPVFHVQADDYNRYFMNQLYELLTEYGPIHEVWFDGAHPKRKGNQQYIKTEWFAMIRKLAPEAAIFGGPDIRWCGNEAGHTRDTEWNVLPVESQQLSGLDRTDQDLGSDDRLAAASYKVYGETYKPKLLIYLIAEVDVSIRHGWFWRNDDEQSVRGPDDVFDMYERSVGGNAGFLLNVPPNNKGLISQRDEACLRQVGKRIRQTYESNLIADLIVDDPAVNGKLSDGKLETYWQPDATEGAISFRLPQPQTVNRFVLQEAISTVGQRIKAHELDAWVDGGWKTIASATTVGYKRILRFPDVTTDRFRIRILDSRLQPTIAEVAAHHYKNESAEQAILKRKVGISKENWKIVDVSSEHDAKYAAAKAIDGDETTFWHTSWADGHPQHPHHLTIDLGETVTISSLSYLPRQDRRVPDGMIEAGEIEFSDNGKDWKHKTAFKFGNLVNDPTARIVTIPETPTAKYVRIVSLSGPENKPYAGAAEIEIFSPSISPP